MSWQSVWFTCHLWTLLKLGETFYFLKKLEIFFKIKYIVPLWVLTCQSAQGLDEPLYFVASVFFLGKTWRMAMLPYIFQVNLGINEVFLGHFHEKLGFADNISCWKQWQILSWFRGYLKLSAETNISGVMLLWVETLCS